MASRRCSLLRCTGLSLPWFLLLWSTAFKVCRLRELQPTGCRSPTQELWRMGLGASRPVKSSGTRDPTHVPSLAGGFLSVAPLWKFCFSLDMRIKVCTLSLWRKVPMVLPRSPAREGNGCSSHSVKRSMASESKVMDSIPPGLFSLRNASERARTACFCSSE